MLKVLLTLGLFFGGLGVLASFLITWDAYEDYHLDRRKLWMVSLEAALYALFFYGVIILGGYLLLKIFGG